MFVPPFNCSRTFASREKRLKALATLAGIEEDDAREVHWSEQDLKSLFHFTVHAKDFATVLSGDKKEVAEAYQRAAAAAPPVIFTQEGKVAKSALAGRPEGWEGVEGEVGKESGTLTVKTSPSENQV
jgi:hypothetical protein